MSFILSWLLRQRIFSITFFSLSPTEKEKLAIEEAKDTMSAKRFRNAIKELVETPVRVTTDNIERRKKATKTGTN